LVAGKLEECFAPADDATLKRRSVLGWLIDRHSVQEMTIAEASAILDWLLDKNADEGTFDLHPAAGSEAAAILAETLREAGQQELAF
jgi:glutathione S-transferase